MTHKILIVDDEPEICNQISEVLNDLGYNTAYAGTGSEALKKAAEERPDLIILDIFMPGMDGVSIYEELRKSEATSQTPVIFLTALAQEAGTQLVQSAHGRYTIIGKPTTMDEILHEIKRTLP